MPSIKTREALRTIKTFDRAKTLGQKIKGGAEEAKEYADELQNKAYQSENEYAGNAVQSTEERVARNSVLMMGKVGNWGLKETRKNIRKWRNRPKKYNLKVDQPKQLPSPWRQALPAPNNGAKKAGQTIKNAEKTAKTAKKTAQATVKASKKAAETTKKAVQATVKAVKATVKAIVAATKAVVAAIKGIVAAIAAGGWIAVLVIVIIVIIGAIIGAVCNVFTPNNTTDKGVTVAQTVREAESEYYQEIERIKDEYDYDMCYVTGEPCELKLAVAVYAVRINGTKNADKYDDEKAELLKETYRSINNIASYTTEREVTETHYEPQEDGTMLLAETTVVKTDLYICVSAMSQKQIEQMYGFDDNQKSLLNMCIRYLIHLLK